MTAHIHNLSTRVIEITGSRPVTTIYGTNENTPEKTINEVCQVYMRVEHDPKGHEFTRSAARFYIVNPEKKIIEGNEQLVLPVLTTPRTRVNPLSTEGFKIDIPQPQRDFLEYYNIHALLGPEFDAQNLIGWNVDYARTFNPVVIAAVDDVVTYLQAKQTRKANHAREFEEAMAFQKAMTSGSLISRLKVAYRGVAPNHKEK